MGAEQKRFLRVLCEIHHVTAEIDRSLPFPGLFRIGAGVNTGIAVLGEHTTQRWATR